MRNFDDENHHKALEFNYYSDAYGTFLAGADDFSEQDQYLERRYGMSSSFPRKESTLDVFYRSEKREDFIRA